MTVRISSAEWQGTLKEGAGRMRVGNGVCEGPYSFASRFEEGAGTNPEELLGAAHAGCFSMFLAALLGEAGYTPQRVATTAKVHLREGPTITLIELATEVAAEGLTESELLKHAEAAKKGCPLSKALAATTITLQAQLL